MATTMFSKAFWAATAERTVRTAAQTLIATLGLDTAGVLDVDWGQGLSLTGSAAFLAVLTAISASGAGGGGPGLTETVRERQ
ncbi:holin [Streptomyces atratus]|uniref:holin n=1 Tax=Streptomyces atratus TaxID=1893 RepID=UPI0032562957